MNILKKIKKWDKYDRYALYILILAIVLRLALFSQYTVAGDACWQLSNAKYIAEEKTIPFMEMFGRDEPFWAPPLYHIITAAVYSVFSIFGYNIADFAAMLVSPIFGIASLILFYFTAKLLVSKRASFYALVFLAFIPLHLDYSIFSYIDGTIAFFALLSVYFALKEKYVLSAIASGLTILTKYNGMFILPVVFYIIYKKRKNVVEFFKRSVLVGVFAGLIGSIWFIRNWVLLGNPVWPFMNSLFKGYEIKSFAQSGVGQIDIMNIFDLNGILSLYLGFFGVPDGNIKTLQFFPIPYLPVLFLIWFAATIIFAIPILIGLFKKMKNKDILLVWIASFALLVLFYIVNSSWSVSRFLLPSFFALALLWGFGVESLSQKRKWPIYILALIMAGFVLTSAVKITLASNEWEKYKADFSWIKENTPKDALLLTNSQCLSYHAFRQTLPAYPEQIDNADYVFVNQNFKLDIAAILPDDVLEEVRAKQKVYENQKTGTVIYQLKE